MSRKKTAATNAPAPSSSWNIVAAVVVVAAAVGAAYALRGQSGWTEKAKGAAGDVRAVNAPLAAAGDAAAAPNGAAATSAEHESWESKAELFDVVAGYIPDGSDLPARPNGTMTFREAVLLCAKEPECAGFTCEASQSSAEPGQAPALLDKALGSQLFYFKTRSMKRIGSGPWLAFIVKNWTPLRVSVPLHEQAVLVRPSTHEILSLIATAYNANYRGPPVESPYLNPQLVGRFNVTVLNTEPIIVMVDSFFSADEAEHLLKLDSIEFKPSGIVDDASVGRTDLRREGLFKETYSAYRTSWTAHCTSTACRKDPVIMAIDSRIAALTSTYPENGEPLQFTRYDIGQEFKVHNDMIPAHASSPAGHRILTVFGYVQPPDAGGETTFPPLGIAVPPVQGRIVVWSNPKDEENSVEDTRTYHAGTPVLAGRKVGFNRWIHRGSYWDAFEDGLG